MPLKYQILVPMAVVTLITVAGLLVISAVMAGHRARAVVERRVGEVAATLETSPFPLTEAVLRQMKGLTGAEFVRTSADGEVLATTIAGLDPTSDLPSNFQLSRLRVGGQQFLGTRMQLRREQRLGSADRPEQYLHALFPEATYSRQWQEAFWPPLLVGGLGLLAMAVLALVIHRRVSRPLERLKSQVERVAEGDFAPMPLPTRLDEVQSLAESVNRMARMLADSEEQVRRTERLRTLGQLGGGLAHHLRNSATGARIALDLHRQDCQAGSDSLDVAQRQLTLMESYLQRFLSIGAADDSPAAMVDVRELLLGLEPLVQPAAGHAHVELTVDAGEAPVRTLGDAAALEQMLVNLLLNAVEAAADARNTGPRQVSATLRTHGAGARIVVADTGLGPSADVAEQLFEPFVTDRPDGVGLGLAVAHQAATRHGGELRWERADERTCFIVEFPLQEAERVTAADR